MVTSKVPLVMVNVLAIPITALTDNFSEVPFKTALYKLAIPLIEDVPVNVAVPADAEKLPLTSNVPAAEKLMDVVIEPLTEKL